MIIVAIRRYSFLYNFPHEYKGEISRVFCSSLNFGGILRLRSLQFIFQGARRVVRLS